VQEQDVGNLVAEGEDLLFAAEGDVLGGGLQVALPEPGDGGLIVLGDAAGVGVVPGVVFEVERDLGCAVAVLLEVGANGVALFRSFRLPTKTDSGTSANRGYLRIE
jgi:hypothetical protein